jgi:hypothetical protein
LLFGQFFVHPLDPTVALLVEALEQLGIDLLLGRADQLRQLASLCDDHPHGIATYAQTPGDLSQRHALLVEQIDVGFTGRLPVEFRKPRGLRFAPDGRLCCVAQDEVVAFDFASGECLGATVRLPRLNGQALVFFP